MTRSDIARLLSLLAADLDGRGDLRAGICRQGALALLEADVQLEEAQRYPDGCVRCGVPLEQPRTGRRRLYCSQACKDAARPPRNSTKEQALSQR